MSNSSKEIMPLPSVSALRFLMIFGSLLQGYMGSLQNRLRTSSQLMASPGAAFLQKNPRSTVKTARTLELDSPNSDRPSEPSSGESRLPTAPALNQKTLNKKSSPRIWANVC